MRRDCSSFLERSHEPREETTVSQSSAMFRKVSLDRLASPEQLDEVMSVTSARTWIALAGLVVLLIVVIIWGKKLFGV